jgi:integrase
VKRTRYQFGTVARKQRKKGPDVWVYRWQEGGCRKSEIIGTLAELQTRTEALRKAQSLQMRANPDQRVRVPVTMSALIDRYICDELESGVRSCTRRSYLSMLEGHIRPKFGHVHLSELEITAVQDWLRGMPAAPKYKSHIRALVHRLYEKAMLWGLINLQRNPIDLVEVRGASKRRRQPKILTIWECYSVLELLPEPYRTMVIVAQCMGLRISEILGLKWEDVDFEKLTLGVRRSVVNGEIGDVKTEVSVADLPLDAEFAHILLHWKKTCPTSSDGWMFPNPVTARPYHASPIQQDYIRDAGRKLGFGDIGWHTFRHTYRAWLDATGAPLGVQQRLMRHADIRTTMNVYGDALMDSKREANSKVVRMVLGPALERAKERTPAKSAVI